MVQSILFSQCLQNDFVQPLGRYDRTPNLLHIGYDEALRLLGEDPENGPVAQLMSWAHGPENKTRLEVIHIRDWHDPTDPAQAGHLAHFGNHCLQGTPGAKFAFALPETPQERIHIVDSLSLNDFHQTGLIDILSPLTREKINVGIAGVWTDAKVSFLAYELATRYPHCNVGVCSAVTASSSRSQHFIALEHLRKILNVSVFDSLGDFVEFLGGTMVPRQTTQHGYSEFPQLTVEGSSNLTREDEQLIRYVFRNSRAVHARVLDGGFSGNVVLGTESTDAYDHREVSHVVKIGNASLIGRERSSFERVESVLGNCAPRIVDFVDLGERGILKYRYASMDGSSATTFQKLYMAGLQLDEVERILRTVFVEQLGRFYAAATKESCSLLDHYWFSSKFAPSVRKKVESLLATPVGNDALVLCGRSVFNICSFYERELEPLPTKPGEGAFFSYLHGDLNGANIIVDGRKNVWLIDFFHTSRGHVLKDLVKLENDLLYIFTPLVSEADLAQAMLLTDHLLEVGDLDAALSTSLPKQIDNPHLLRAYSVLKLLRSFYPALIRSDRDPLQLLIGQVRYAVHTLSFDESSVLQKKWALYTAARAAEEIVARYRRGDRLRVDWLKEVPGQTGTVGMTLLPGRKDFARNLEHDLQTLRQEGVKNVVCLVTLDELAWYGVPDLLQAYRDSGFDSLHFPIPDQGVSTVEDMKHALEWISARTARGEKVLLHCAGGLGRSGTVAACFLKRWGAQARTAIEMVRQVRSRRAIETVVQEQFVQNFPISE
ncbi:MAG: isochorismatase family protein [Bdellovibrionota bacterium]